MTTTIESFQALHAALQPYREQKLYVFRGHADASWPLLPKAGRPLYRRVRDSIVFAAWKRRAVEFMRPEPRSDWEWLAAAQHHGLATRLLDWSTNPLIAAYFAVAESVPSDAVLYAARFARRADTAATPNPLDYSKVALYYPSGVVPRIARQGGLFSIHPDPAEPLSDKAADLKGLDEFVVPAAARAPLRSELSFYGFNSSTLFPDLDGLSAFLNWTVESGEYWNVVTDPDPGQDIAPAGPGLSEAGSTA